MHELFPTPRPEPGSTPHPLAFLTRGRGASFDVPDTLAGLDGDDRACDPVCDGLEVVAHQPPVRNELAPVPWRGRAGAVTALISRMTVTDTSPGAPALVHDEATP